MCVEGCRGLGGLSRAAEVFGGRHVGAAEVFGGRQVGARLVDMLELVLSVFPSCQSFLRPFELVVRSSFERLSCVSEAERPRGRLTWLHPSNTNLARLKTNLPRSLARTHTHAGMAQFALGWRYASGIGCQQNDEMAVNLYRKAASRGITGTNAYLSCHHRYLECLEICTKRRNGCKSVAQSSEQGFSRATRGFLRYRFTAISNRRNGYKPVPRSSEQRHCR